MAKTGYRRQKERVYAQALIIELEAKLDSGTMMSTVTSLSRHVHFDYEIDAFGKRELIGLFDS